METSSLISSGISPIGLEGQGPPLTVRNNLNYVFFFVNCLFCLLRFLGPLSTVRKKSIKCSVFIIISMSFVETFIKLISRVLVQLMLNINVLLTFTKKSIIDLF